MNKKNPTKTPYLGKAKTLQSSRPTRSTRVVTTDKQSTNDRPTKDPVAKKRARANETLKPSEKPPEDNYVPVSCLSCQGAVSDEKHVTNSIQCDRCSGWVHARPMCSGLSIAAFQLFTDSAHLLYSCSACLTRKAPGAAGGQSPDKNTVSAKDFNHLEEMVRGLCSEVNKLLEGPTRAVQEPSSSRRTTATSNQGDENKIRKMIREEAQDSLERERRKEFIMVRGFEADESDTTCSDLVSEIFEELTGREVTFSNFLRFDNRPDLVRVKVINENDRKTIISNSINLRNSERSRFFVRRDLTWLQRRELSARYEKRKAEKRDRPDDSSASRPPKGAPHLNDDGGKMELARNPAEPVNEAENP